MDVFIGDIYWMNFREDLEYLNFTESLSVNDESFVNYTKFIKNVVWREELKRYRVSQSS